MEYLVLAYGLIALVLIGYAYSLWQRRAAIERERALIESSTD